MKRTVLAIAVGAALATAGVAQAEVTLSGLAHISVDSIDDGADSYLYVSSNSSKLTFKGSEDLGDGMKGNWMFDTTVVMDGAGTSVFDRETYVGLSGGFGAFNIGKQDTPMKKLARKVDFFGDQIGDSRAIINEGNLNYKVDMNGDGDFSDIETTESYTNTTTSTSTNTDSTRSVSTERETDTMRGFGLDARPGNAITFTSPDMGGVTASLMYVPEDGAKDASLLGLGVNYVAGPLFVGVSYESHGKGLNNSSPSTVTTRDVTATAAGSIENSNDVTVTAGEEESAMRLAASFTMGDAKVAGLIQTVTNARGVDGADRMTFGLGGSYKIGAGTIKAQYYMAGEYDCTGCEDSGSTLLALGYDHALSKTTTIYAAYAMAAADDNGAGTVTGAWHNTATAVVLDAATGEAEDVSALSFGVKHSF